MTSLGLLSRAPQALPEGLISEEAAAPWKDLKPIYALLYVENRCHLRCDHCYESEESHPTSHHLSLEEYDALFDELAELGVFMLTFTGGEIFLRRDLLDIVARARKRRFAVRLYTSGTLMNEEKADRIRDLGVTGVEISLYSHDPAVHDNFTGTPGSHAKSCHGVRLLRERGVPVTVKCSILRFNVDALEELALQARELDASLVLNPLVHPRTDGSSKPLQYRVPPDELARRYYENPHLTDLFQNDVAENYCDGENPRSNGDELCAAGRRLLTIGAGGEIFPCGLFPVAGGNIRERPVAETWRRSALFHRLRSLSFSAMNECPTCDVQSTCHPCMANAYVESGDIANCCSTSRNDAEATRQAAERRRAAEAKLEKGRSLPILGDRAVPSLQTATVGHATSVVL